jgi:hypothetical protein
MPSPNPTPTPATSLVKVSNETRASTIGREMLERQRTVLVVGVRDTNIGEWYHYKDKRLVLWFTDDCLKAKVPQNTGIILNTSFVNHHIMSRIESMMPKDAHYFPRRLGTHELKRMLEEIFGGTPESLKRLAAAAASAEPLKSAAPKPAGNGGGNGGSSGGPGGGPSGTDSSRLLANFIAQMPKVQEAYGNVMKENTLLSKQVRDLENSTAQALTRAGEAEHAMNVAQTALARAQSDLEAANALTSEVNAKAEAAEERVKDLETKLEKFQGAFDLFAQLSGKK